MHQRKLSDLQRGAARDFAWGVTHLNPVATAFASYTLFWAAVAESVARPAVSTPRPVISPLRLTAPRGEVVDFESYRDRHSIQPSRRALAEMARLGIKP